MRDPSPRIEDAVAIIPVADVAASIGFYRDVLGFEERMISEDEMFGIVVHGEAALHFVKASDAAALAATANHISVYLWVNGLDALYGELKPKLAGLEKDRVRPPFDQPYGMREFHVKDPDGCLLLFGETSEKPT